MYVLGYSGLNDAMTFKRLNMSGLTEQEYRISQGMDAAAALIKDGVVIAAAEEERFTGVKHTEQFPKSALKFCLATAGVSISDVDYICHCFNYPEYKYFFQQTEKPYLFKYYQEALDPAVQIQHLNSLWPGVNFEKKFIPVQHHRSHAASAFYPSGFSEALVLVMDGMGELDSITICRGKGNRIEVLKNYSLLNSIGMLYSIITLHLGFSINSGEYKVMGLAAYGDPNRYAAFFSECVSLEPEGEILIRGFYKNKTSLDWETYRGFREWLTENTFPERKPEEKLAQHHMDLAAGMQMILNKALLHICKYWQNITRLNYLCYAGGVALNCTANGYLYHQKLFKNIYIQPAAGDAGTAIGSALYHYKHNLQQSGTDLPQRMPFFGPTSQIDQFLNEEKKWMADHHIVCKKINSDELVHFAAENLAQGKIIAWVQGELEFGPRALGHRSILADPRDSTMREKINRIVKKREIFRPFAPSVKSEKAHYYFEIEEKDAALFNTMLFIVGVRDPFKEKLSAITHVDGTARLQTVDQLHNPLYWKLLHAFEEKTGLPILLNTSFNVNKQPMIAFAKEALTTFAESEIDLLCMDNFIFFKIRKTYEVSSEQYALVE